mmetsp:Transcript_35069/g.110835  ORF Transcript_35069/g.110835 Transcript_35069/m.110835 type:complete len:495 (+) Transcript_35069:765-2249(+)
MIHSVREELMGAEGREDDAKHLRGRAVVALRLKQQLLLLPIPHVHRVPVVGAHCEQLAASLSEGHSHDASHLRVPEPRDLLKSAAVPYAHRWILAHLPSGNQHPLGMEGDALDVVIVSAKEALAVLFLVVNDPNAGRVVHHLPCGSVEEVGARVGLASIPMHKLQLETCIRLDFGPERERRLPVRGGEHSLASLPVEDLPCVRRRAPRLVWPLLDVARGAHVARSAHEERLGKYDARHEAAGVLPILVEYAHGHVGGHGDAHRLPSRAELGEVDHCAVPVPFAPRLFEDPHEHLAVHLVQLGQGLDALAHPILRDLELIAQLLLRAQVCGHLAAPRWCCRCRPHVPHARSARRPGGIPGRDGAATRSGGRLLAAATGSKRVELGLLRGLPGAKVPVRSPVYLGLPKGRAVPLGVTRLRDLLRQPLHLLLPGESRAGQRSIRRPLVVVPLVPVPIAGLQDLVHRCVTPGSTGGRRCRTCAVGPRRCCCHRGRQAV